MSRGVREARRVISLLPAATDMIAALGAWERIVGVTHECDALPPALMPRRVTRPFIDGSAPPAEVDAAVSAAASLGTSMFALDADAIRDAHPDLIITQALCDVCAVSEDEVRGIASTIDPAPQIVSLDATRFDDVLASIGLVAQSLGLEDEGLDVLNGVRVRLRTIHERLKREKAPRPRVAVIEWSDPLYAAGHWVPDMVRRAGGIDVMGTGGEHSKRALPDEFRAAEPDVVVVAACGYNLERSASEGERLLADPSLQWLRSRRVWAMDGNALTSRPGPRLCSGVEVLSRILHPALFSPPRLDLARQLLPR